MVFRSNRFFSVFLLSRPYTLFGVLLLAILANVLTVGKLVFDALLCLDLLFAASFWLGIMYLGEYLHKNVDKRVSFSFLLPLFFFVISFGVAFLRNYLTILLLLFSVVSVFLYSSKSKNWILSPFLFFFRGTIEFSIFLAIVLMNHAELSVFVLVLACSFYFLTISRNLVGDLRDASFDKFTFPKKFGFSLTKVFVLVFGFVAAFLMPDLVSTIPILFSLLLLLIGLNYFFVHHFYVFSTYFVFLLLMAYFLGYDQLFLILAYVCLLFGFTYKLVPRKSNKEVSLY